MNRTRQRTRLAVEHLEARETPAGVVDVAFANGSILLIGDANSNYISINTGLDGADRIQVKIGDASHGTMFRLNDATPSAEIALPGELTGAIAIRLGDGADTVTFGDVRVPGSVLIQGGEGNNSIDVAGELTVVKNLSVTNGSGLDQVTVSGRLEVGGRVRIYNHAGGSLLSSTGSSLIKAGNLSVTNGDGLDRLELQGVVVVLGNFSNRNGPGGSFWTDGPDTAIGVGGTLSVTNGAGEDEIDLGSGHTVKAGSISIRHGLGNSNTTITLVEEGLYADRNLTIVGGPEVDRVQLGAPGVALALEVRGSVLVNLGTGDGSVDIYAGKLTVKGRIGVSAGDGQNEVNITTQQNGTVGAGVGISLGTGENQAVNITGLSIAGSLRVRTADNTRGSGSNEVNLQGVQVGRETVIATGAGNDRLLVSFCTFGGPFVLSTGAGNDSVAIESGIVPYGVSHFNRTVNVRTGEGDDSVVVGNFNPVAYGEFAAASYWDGGPGTGDQIDFEDFNVFTDSEPVITGFDS